MKIESFTHDTKIISMYEIPIVKENLLFVVVAAMLHWSRTIRPATSDTFKKILK